jgi:plastocyanin
MKSKPISALFGLLALVAILGVAPAFGSTEVDIASGAGSSASAACVTTNNCFAPNPVNIAPGDEVEWKNTDSVSHTVTSGKVTDDNAGSMFDSGLIKKGNEFKFTFADAGTYDYFCTVHPWMVGQVVVGGATSTTPETNTTTPTDNATVPEFGPVASIVLAIAVLSMVVFAAKTRVIPKF